MRLVPQAQQDQYQLINCTITVNLREMLNTLVMIKKWTFKFPRKLNILADESVNRKGKRKVSGTEDSLPWKKKHSSKYCTLCSKHGGAKTTHNTGDCRKIVENMRKTGSLKRHSNPRKGSPPSIRNSTTSLLRQRKILSRKWKLTLRKLRSVLANQRSANAMIWVNPTALEELG